MRYLDLTLPTPAANLALEEALLDAAEAAEGPSETLRFWELDRPTVVVGRSSRLAAEVDRHACRQLGVPVLRRVSGGAAVLAGPGCLMYSLVLSFAERPALRKVDAAHRFVLGTMAKALRPMAPEIRCQGISDLALGQRKCSGNSVRLKRDHLLYHGTLLYDFPLELIEQCLTMPPRQPEYRNGRSHEQFVTNLPVDAATIRQALVTAWQADEPYGDWPRQRTTELAAAKYNRAEWNEQY